MSIKRPRWIVWVLLLLWLIPQHNGIQAQDTPLSIAEQVNNLTLEQKVAQMMIVSIFGPAVNEPAAAMIRTWQPGAIVLLPSNLENPAQITRLTNEIQTITLENGTIPAFITVDQEGGIIARLDEGFTDWPVPSLLTATGNTDLAYAFGQALATELRAVGINMNLAPVADLQSEIDNPVIGRRAFGDDPVQVSPIVASVIAGMQDTNVLATAKHFPGHGATTVDSHLELPVLPFTAEELFNRELLPFTTAIENASVGAIMMSHIHFPTFDPDEALPASLSQNIVTGLLRNRIGYDGIILTDALDMDAIDTVYSPEESVIRAIQAGNDMVLVGAHTIPSVHISVMQALVEAVRAGTIPESQIDASVTRILQAKAEMNVLNWQPLDDATANERINTEAHSTLIQQMFTEGTTIAQDTNSLLPLSANSLVIYPGTRPSLDDICERPGVTKLSVNLNPTPDDIQRASIAARSVDTVVYFTQNVTENLQQATLVENLPLDRTVVVALWSPFDYFDLPVMSTYVVVYSPFLVAHTPVCDILHGDAPALGTLSVDFSRPLP